MFADIGPLVLPERNYAAANDASVHLCRQPAHELQLWKLNVQPISTDTAGNVGDYGFDRRRRSGACDQAAHGTL
jgi:hypothetical protein